MFIGHYSVGFVLKRRFKEIPLWLLFVSVQFADILVFLFVLLGIERIKYNESANPFLRTTIEYVPFTHSLFGNVILTVLVLLAFWKLKNKVWALLLSIGVLSHWFLDFIVHVPDMPLFLDRFKVGLGLWQYPRAAFIIELAMLLLAGFYLLRGLEKNKRHIILIILLVAGFASMFFAPAKEISSAVAAIFCLIIYIVFTALAYWCDRQKER